MEKSLFRVKTRGCGVFHVIATTFDYAAGKVTRELNAQDYGYSGDRVVTNVEFICRETFMQNGKRALYGDNDINHFIICDSTDPEKIERHYAEQLAKLTEENEMLKQEIRELTARPEKTEDFDDVDPQHLVHQHEDKPIAGRLYILERDYADFYAGDYFVGTDDGQLHHLRTHSLMFYNDESKDLFYDTGMQHDPAANAAETAYLESLAAKYKKKED